MWPWGAQYRLRRLDKLDSMVTLLLCTLCGHSALYCARTEAEAKLQGAMLTSCDSRTFIFFWQGSSPVGVLEGWSALSATTKCLLCLSFTLCEQAVAESSHEHEDIPAGCGASLSSVYALQTSWLRPFYPQGLSLMGGQMVKKFRTLKTINHVSVPQWRSLRGSSPCLPLTRRKWWQWAETTLASVWYSALY